MPTHADVSRSREHQVLAVRANVERAALKLEVERGETPVAAAVYSAPAQRMLVLDVLRAQSGWGSVRARKRLRVCGIGEQTTCGQMTERQRERLLEVLGGGR